MLKFKIIFSRLSENAAISLGLKFVPETNLDETEGWQKLKGDRNFVKIGFKVLLKYTHSKSVTKNADFYGAFFLRILTK